jgi:hypothetical protein
MVSRNSSLPQIGTYNNRRVNDTPLTNMSPAKSTAHRLLHDQSEESRSLNPKKLTREIYKPVNNLVYAGTVLGNHQLKKNKELGHAV